ncbi:MAG: tRNA (adenosine(37)-N6)-threonylcarbamoyltransferase complex ATPase subunit type 1 TsaE [Bacteroidota bacterium]|nr:tRNA (adenosine(37)-N6)-threonylcarbamoyltransferase complex ATPase subunit type 1 TsaE [Bacteroidota bacterium]
MTIDIPTIDQLDKGAQTFLDATGGKGIFAFYGDMGAGKTTFITAVCKQMGIQDVINSPTFAIINEYSLPSGEPVYHFDFYRIKNAEEAFNIGCEDYFESGRTCFIEWPEKIGTLLPDDCTRVDITVSLDGHRTVTF